MKTITTVFLTTLLVYAASASDIGLKWSGEMRVRGEVDGRDFLHRTPMNAYTLLRTRLGVEVAPATNIRLFIKLQDARLFGQVASTGAANTASTLRNTDLYTAYLRIDSLFAPDMSLMLGRMQLSYGNQRLIGALDWSNTGRTFDGGLLRLKSGENQFDLFSANVAEYSVPPGVVSPASVAGKGGEGYLLSGLYTSLRVSDNVTVEPFLLHEWSKQAAGTPEADMSRATVGMYSRGSAGNFFYEADAAYQFGDMGSKNIAAVLLSGFAGWKFEKNFLASCGVGYDYLSGSADTSTVKTFFVPFNTGHKFYGFMDYFVNIPASTAHRGLHNLIVRVVTVPSDNTTLTFWFHNFTAAARSQLPSASFGQELDIVGSLAYNKHLSFEAGASVFLPGDLFRSGYAGSDAALWGYATTRVWF